jgi:multisubunit Na+/H+ antiporter MnhE subunit
MSIEQGCASAHGISSIPPRLPRKTCPVGDLTSPRGLPGVARGKPGGVSGEAGSRASTWAMRWLVLAALWLALADSRTESELIAAAVVATLGATFSTAILRPGNPRTARGLLALGRLGPRTLLRPPWRLIADTGVLASAVWRRLVRRQNVRGSFRAARHQPDMAVRSSAGRAATEIWGSLTPNRYVIGVDDERGEILIHELVPAEEPLDPLTRR